MSNMTCPRSSEEIQKILGDREALKQELAQFNEDAVAFSREMPRFIQLYPDQFVAFFRGEVQSHSTNLNVLVEEVRGKGIPPENCEIRFIARERQMMIL
jgi:hypothetical protein